jgi:hypothetical protein
MTVAELQSRTVAQASAGTESIPWYIWSCLLAVICSVVGGAWDISWHESVGRDTFWTTPHMLIQLCGVLSGISCGYLILSTTFLRNWMQERSIGERRYPAQSTADNPRREREGSRPCWLQD